MDREQGAGHVRAYGPGAGNPRRDCDPQNLNLSLKVNGVEKQNSNTKFMLFNIAELIHDLSTVFTLEAGDIIATGTPAGVGAAATRRNGCGRATW